MFTKSNITFFLPWLKGRGGVPEDVLGLEDTFSSPWPRGCILKSLASKPQVLENWPVLGSRTALFLNRWNFVGKRQKSCGKSAKTFFWFPQVEIAWNKIFEDLFRLKKFLKTFFFEMAWKKNFEDLFFLENTCVCVLGPWSWHREGLALASSLVSSTYPLLKGFPFN